MSQFADLFAMLAAPIDSHLILQREGAGGRMLDYVTARTVMDRLDHVLGPENWWDHYQIIPGGILCALTIRLPSGELLTKEDAGGPQGMKDSGDDMKSAFSDALKRAAVKFGVARYLEVPEERGRPQPERTAPSPRPQPQRAPVRDHSQHFPTPPDFPKTGREFFAWIRQTEKDTGHELLKKINAEAKKLDITGRTIDWSPEQVTRLFAYASQILNAPSLPIS